MHSLGFMLHSIGLGHAFLRPGSKEGPMKLRQQVKQHDCNVQGWQKHAGRLSAPPFPVLQVMQSETY